jgi:hypothetical protein
MSATYLLDNSQAFEYKFFGGGVMNFGNIGGIFTDIQETSCSYLITKPIESSTPGKFFHYIWINLQTLIDAVGAPGDGLCSLKFPNITFQTTYTFMESFIVIPINKNFNILHQSAIYNNITNEVDFIVHSTSNQIGLNATFSIQAIIESYT